MSTEDMSKLSFKERLALRAKTIQAEPDKPAPAAEPKPVEAPRRFGQPKPTETTSDDQKLATSSNEPQPKPSRFGGGFKKSIPAGDILPEAEQAKPEGSVEEAQSAGPLPKVIQAYNTVGGQTNPVVTDGELLSGHEGDAVVKKIQEKIIDLGFADNETELKHEMQKLQSMLVENPAACLYLLDEDLGRAVQALRKMTNNRVAADMAQAKPSRSPRATDTSTKPLSLEEMNSALDEL